MSLLAAQFERQLWESSSGASSSSSSGGRCLFDEDAALVVVSPDLLSKDEITTYFPHGQAIVVVRATEQQIDTASVADDNSNLASNKAVQTAATTTIRRVRWCVGSGEQGATQGFSAGDRKTVQSISASRAIFLLSFDQASGRMMRGLRECGIKRFSFLEDDPKGGVRWQHHRGLGAIAAKSINRASLRLPPWLRARADSTKEELKRRHGRISQPGVDALTALKLDDCTNHHTNCSLQGNPTNVTHYISSLTSGGAERQLTLLLESIVNVDPRVAQRVFTMMPIEGSNAHYSNDLHRLGVDVSCAAIGSPHKPVGSHLDEIRIPIALLSGLPSRLRRPICDLMETLWYERPTVLHSWLDYPNIVAGIAGIALGIPRIVLSVRNVSPTHFAYIHEDWMQPLYRWLFQHPSVVLSANSEIGAHDYAAWLGVEQKKIVVIPNSVRLVETSKNDDQSNTTRLRICQELNIENGGPVLIGVFRLSEEKLPLDFVEVVKKVHKEYPSVRALLAGVGPLERQVRHAIQQNKLEEVITLLGSRDDISSLLELADVLILTSREEGMPNCVLEAMAAGVAVVATDSRGSAGLIKHGHTGWLAPINDCQKIAERICDVLENRHEKERVEKQALEYVREQHSMQTAANSTIEMYSRR